MLQEAEARSKQHASRMLADEVKQYQQELRQQQIAKRSQQKAVRDRLQAQIHETQRQRDAAAAEVCSCTWQRAVLPPGCLLHGKFAHCYAGINLRIPHKETKLASGSNGFSRRQQGCRVWKGKGLSWRLEMKRLQGNKSACWTRRRIKLLSDQ